MNNDKVQALIDYIDKRPKTLEIELFRLWEIRELASDLLLERNKVVLEETVLNPVPAGIVQETISSTWNSAFVAGIDACIAKAEEGVTPAWLIVELKQMKAERLKDYEIK